MLKSITRRYNKVRKYDYKRLLAELRIYFFIFLILLIVFLFVFGYVRMYYNFDSNIITSLLWSLMCSIVYGGILVAYGVRFNITNLKTAVYILVIIILIVFITGIGTWNITFQFNFPIFLYKNFSLSSAEGLRFGLYNNYIFLGIYVITFPFEHEKK